MNKKQILKEQKRLKMERRQTEKLFNDDKEVYNIFKILLGVIAFIGLAFALINIANGTWNIFNKSNKTETQIDPNMVMVGTMFNKEDGEYLVLAYDMSDDNSTYYAALAERYSGILKLYYLDLSSGFNRDYLAETSVMSSDSTKIKFSGPTLMLINKDYIAKSYTTEKEIANYLTNEQIEISVLD